MQAERKVESLPLNQEDIERCARRMGYAEIEANQRFLNLNPDEQKACIKLINRGLYFAIERRYSLEVIKVFALHDQESLQDSNKIFDSYSAYTNLTPQKGVLSYFINIFKEKNIPYDPVHALKTVIKFCHDNDAVCFLDLHANLLNPELCQSLLDLGCELTIRPRCILKLVSLGAPLQERHFKKMSTFLDKEVEILNGEAGLSDQTLINLFSLMEEKKISIPVFPSYFANFGEKELKKVLVANLPINNLQILSNFDDAIIKAAHYKYVYADRAEKRFLLNNIQILFDRFPQYRPANPEEFEFLAFCSIRLQHSLIHTLLERGLTLLQKFNCLESWPEEMRFSNPQGNTLADIAAFYSRDKKLLAKLGNISSINYLNRTPSHYAVFPISEISKTNYTIPFQKEHYGMILDRERPDNMTIVSEEMRDRFCLYHLDFTNTTLSIQFKKTDSPHTYGNTNFVSGDIKDVIGFRPLDYAGMIEDENENKFILKQYSIFLYRWLCGLQIMPSVLITLIVQYTESHKDSAENLVIRWAEKFVEKRSLFSSKIQSWLIDPLQSRMNAEQKLIQNPDNVFLARIILQAFNLATCVGTVSCFNGSAIFAKKSFRGKASSSADSFSTANAQSFLVSQKRKTIRSENNEPLCKALRLE